MHLAVCCMKNECKVCVFYSSGFQPWIASLYKHDVLLLSFLCSLKAGFWFSCFLYGSTDASILKISVNRNHFLPSSKLWSIIAYPPSLADRMFTAKCEDIKYPRLVYFLGHVTTMRNFTTKRHFAITILQHIATLICDKLCHAS